MRFQKKSPQQQFEGITTKERVHSQPCGKRSRSIHNFTFISSDFAFAGCMEEALLLANTGCSSRGREIKEKHEEERKKNHCIQEQLGATVADGRQQEFYLLEGEETRDGMRKRLHTRMQFQKSCLVRICFFFFVVVVVVPCRVQDERLLHNNPPRRSSVMARPSE